MFHHSFTGIGTGMYRLHGASSSRLFSICRFRSTTISSSQAKRSPLAVLRSNTGYPFSKCKEALVKHNNDVVLAEQYLRDQAQKEGWAKAAKVKGRATNQGLIGVLTKDNKGVMVEVNCETDFVSKNSEFQKMVASVVENAYDNFKTATNSTTRVRHITSSDMASLGVKSTNNTGTIGDMLAKIIGHFGENITVSRGCFTSAGTNETLSSYAYNSIAVPESSVVLGTYASFVLLKLIGGEDGCIRDDGSSTIEGIGQQVAQHVVGMNPVGVSKEQETDREGQCLVDQNYLLDESVKVGDWLKSNRVEVTEFVRYELGDDQ